VGNFDISGKYRKQCEILQNVWKFIKYWEIRKICGNFENIGKFLKKWEILNILGISQTNAKFIITNYDIFNLLGLLK
jgi:hypothetical protein